MEVNFKDGIARLKAGRRTIVTITDLAVKYPNLNRNEFSVYLPSLNMLRHFSTLDNAKEVALIWFNKLTDNETNIS